MDGRKIGNFSKDQLADKKQKNKNETKTTNDRKMKKKKVKFPLYVTLFFFFFFFFRSSSFLNSFVPFCSKWLDVDPQKHDHPFWTIRVDY